MLFTGFLHVSVPGKIFQLSNRGDLEYLSWFVDLCLFLCFHLFSVHYANLLVQALLEKWPESRALKTSLELAAMNTTGSASGGIPTGVSSHHHSSSSAHSTSTSNSQDIPYSPHSANQKIGSEEHLHSQQMPPGQSVTLTIWSYFLHQLAL